MPIKELVTMLRALDVDPRDNEEINDLVQKADPNNEGFFTKEALLAIMEDKLRDPDTVEALIERFKLLDRSGSGKISIPEFKQYMMVLGKKFTEEQVEEMIDAADPKGKGFIDINTFSDYLCPPKPDK